MSHLKNRKHEAKKVYGLKSRLTTNNMSEVHRDNYILSRINVRKFKKTSGKIEYFFRKGLFLKDLGLFQKLASYLKVRFRKSFDIGFNLWNPKREEGK